MAFELYLNKNNVGIKREEERKSNESKGRHVSREPIHRCVRLYDAGPGILQTTFLPC
jgi:hypothetical protein